MAKAQTMKMLRASGRSAASGRTGSPRKPQPNGFALGKNRKVVIFADSPTYSYLKLAAKLRNQSVTEYVKRAINTSMRNQGVDGALFRESDDE